MVAERRLPHKLKLLLSHPRILKAGRLVSADLKCLEAACQSHVPFVGGLDLAKYAKERHVAPNAKCSLADLSALVLSKRLNKDVSERVSDQWENEILSREQLTYAAGDAYASLCIYNSLSRHKVPSPLPSQLLEMTPVLLYNADNTTVIAHGHLSPDLHAPSYDDINLTQTWTLVTISEVLVPGAIITTHRKRPLNSFGVVPFSVVCLRTHLRTFDHIARHPESVPPLPPPLLPPVLNAPQLSSAIGSDSGPLPGSEELEASVADIIAGHGEQPDSTTTIDNHQKDVDQASQALGEKVLGPHPTEWDSTIYSHVLKDPFHVFNMFYISRRHGLRVAFARALRDAMFIYDKTDIARINAWGATQNPKQDFEQLLRSSPVWVHKRCKRIIPPPNILYPLISAVFRIYGPLKDSVTGAPLFTADNWRTAKNILDLIYRGYLSDPPGIALYSIIGVDSQGLPTYRCVRGTNFTEGGVHTHLRSHLPTSGASVTHVHARLLDFILHHNLIVCNPIILVNKLNY